MSNASVPEGLAHAAPRSMDAIADAIEEEIARLRVARPHLESRIDRASGLLVVHLSDPRSGVIKVRVDVKRGRRRYLVESLNSGGAVYSVEPEPWRCSCPDFHRRGQPCKHLLACYLLERADRRLRPLRAKPGCERCYGGWVYLGEEVVDAATGELVVAHNPVRCRRCQGEEPPYMTDDELEAWMEDVRWIGARSEAHPHQYTLRRDQDEARFSRVVQTIWDRGWDRVYLFRPWRTLELSGFFLWVYTWPKRGMKAPLSQTILVNRTEIARLRLVH